MDDAPEPLIPAPRHLRKRRLRPELPDTLFVSREKAAELARRQHARPQHQPAVQASGELIKRRKRALALAILMLVSLSIPALILALILAR